MTKSFFSTYEVRNSDLGDKMHGNASWGSSLFKTYFVDLMKMTTNPMDGHVFDLTNKVFGSQNLYKLFFAFSCSPCFKYKNILSDI